MQLLDAIFPKSSEACVDYHTNLNPVTHEQITTIFKTALEQILEEEKADVKSILQILMESPSNIGTE